MSHAMLSDIRVADFTWIGAGSFTTKLLADFGADVIKIESSERLDTLRVSRPFAGGLAGVNRSGYFSDRNSSKRSVTLNLKHAAGKSLALEIIKKSDVVANNFTPGTMEKFGLGYEAVRQACPEIIYLAMSMQGATGPQSRYLGYGLTIGALTGLQYLSGHPAREPAGTGTNFSDHIPNPCHAAFATLAALRHRRRTGQGQYIDVAQTEPTIALIGPAVIAAALGLDGAERTGNDRGGYLLHGVFPCAGVDRWIAIAATDKSAVVALSAVLGHPPELDFATRADTSELWAHRRSLEQAIAARTLAFDADELMRALQRVGVVCGAVRNAEDLVTRDEQLAHRKHWVKLDHPEMGRSIYNAPPFRMGEADSVPSLAAPQLGQHTREICMELLGLSGAEVDALGQDGALV